MESANGVLDWQKDCFVFVVILWILWWSTEIWNFQILYELETTLGQKYEWNICIELSIVLYPGIKPQTSQLCRLFPLYLSIWINHSGGVHFKQDFSPQSDLTRGSAVFYYSAVLFFERAKLLFKATTSKGFFFLLDWLIAWFWFALHLLVLPLALIFKWTSLGWAMPVLPVFFIHSKLAAKTEILTNAIETLLNFS